MLFSRKREHLQNVRETGKNQSPVLRDLPGGQCSLWGRSVEKEKKHELEELKSSTGLPGVRGKDKRPPSGAVRMKKKESTTLSIRREQAHIRDAKDGRLLCSLRHREEGSTKEERGWLDGKEKPGILSREGKGVRVL